MSLKIDNSLLRMLKIIEIGWIFPAEKRDSKTITNAHINRFGAPKGSNVISFYLFRQTLAKDNTELNTHVKVKK